MADFCTQVLERFLRYVKIDTQSDADSSTAPSTMKQKNLAKMLVDELFHIGVQDVHMSEECVVYGTIPSTLEDGKGISVGFIVHMDNAPGVPTANVKPWVLKNYQGGDVLLNKEQNIVAEVSRFPNLNKYIGQDIVFTDGTTQLGGDDKAALAAMMTMAEHLCSHPEIPHGPVQIAFTPDEQIGRGIDNFEIGRFGADVAYTVDCPRMGELGTGSFHGGEAVFTVHGIAIHPGEAKDMMKNAVLIGTELINMLPHLERPQDTEGMEGYFHAYHFEGSVDEARVKCLIRDHDRQRFEERVQYVWKCAEALNKRYGKGTIELKYTEGQHNMKEIIDTVPFMVDYALQAMEAAGVEAKTLSIRGGSDGVCLCEKGLPCPNISAGYENEISRFEFVPVQSMEKMLIFY